MNKPYYDTKQLNYNRNIFDPLKCTKILTNWYLKKQLIHEVFFVPVTRHSQSQKMVQPFCLYVIKKTDFQLIKVIHKDSGDGGSGSNDDNDVKDYGLNYGDSYSNHHEICDDKDDNDDDNSDNNDQKMNARINLHIRLEGFQV